MIKQIKTGSIIQKCNCGHENEHNYENIEYIKKKNVSYFKIPLCNMCEQRIEFIIINENMTKEEFQLMVKMRQLGFMES